MSCLCKDSHFLGAVVARISTRRQEMRAKTESRPGLPRGEPVARVSVGGTSGRRAGRPGVRLFSDVQPYRRVPSRLNSKANHRVAWCLERQHLDTGLDVHVWTEPSSPAVMRCLPVESIAKALIHFG